MGRKLQGPALCFVLCVSPAVTIIAAPSDPQLFSPISGPPNGVPGGRDPVWSQPADLNGFKVSSEVISSFDLESEIADDFVLPYVGYTTGAVFWGGDFNWSPGDPDISTLNVRIYADEASEPGSLLIEYLALPVEATFVGYDGNGYPTYRYSAEFSFYGGDPPQRYWIAFQAGDHPYPPQWGRQQALEQVDNQAMFRSSYFGYDAWTPVSDIFSIAFDTSFEVGCIVIPGMSGACCLPDGHCTYADAVHCGDFLHGTWHPCISCVDADCPDAEACCFPDGTCRMLTASGCDYEGGQSQGPGTECEPNPCEPTPATTTTYGKLRTTFR